MKASAKVTKQSTKCLSIEFEKKESCHNCQAKDNCAENLANKTIETVVETSSEEKISEGDTVNIYLSNSKFVLSIFLAYILPVIIVVVSSIFLTGNMPDLLIALILLIEVVLYFFSLFILTKLSIIPASFIKIETKR